jgi:hypothetical protein
VRDTGLLDAGADALDRLTGMAARLVGAPTAVVSLVTDDRQVFAGQVGLGEAATTIRETPLSQSFCRFVVADDAPPRRCRRGRPWSGGGASISSIMLVCGRWRPPTSSIVVIQD